MKSETLFGTMSGDGLCECGCGGETKISLITRRKLGFIKGLPYRFILNHHLRARVGSKNPSWKGGEVRSQGYVLIRNTSHPRTNNGYVGEHVLVAEKALGRFLPACHPVHHVNEVRSDNKGSNLVICESPYYHKLLHMRARAYKATGNVNAVRCRHCREWGVRGQNGMSNFVKGATAYHATCVAAHRRPK